MPSPVTNWAIAMQVKIITVKNKWRVNCSRSRLIRLSLSRETDNKIQNIKIGSRTYARHKPKPVQIFGETTTAKPVVTNQAKTGRRKAPNALQAAETALTPLS